MPSPEGALAALPDWLQPGDPWLPDKMRQHNEILAAERELGPLVEQALARLLAEAREHVGGDAVTAAGLRAWAARHRFWLTLLTALLFGPLTALFVARFGREFTGRVTVDPQPLADEFLRRVAENLAAWPDQVLDDVDRDRAAGLPVDELLDIDARSRRTRAEMARLRRTIEDPDTRDGVRREARARLAVLRRDDPGDRFWRGKVLGAVRNLALSALNAGTHAGADAFAAQTGTKRFKQWWSMEDGLVRPAHRKAHGQVRPVDEDFLVGGFRMRYPLDPDAPADLVANCRCSLLSMSTSQAGTQMSLHADRIDPQEGVTMSSALEIHEHEVPEAELPPLLAAGTELAEQDTTVRWRGVLAPLGVRSGDNRMLAAPESGVPETRTLPIPILYMEKTGPGHDNSVVVGRIDRVWIEGSSLMGEGVFDLENDTAREVVRQIDGGYHRWVSVRVDKATSEYVLYRGEEVIDGAEFLHDGEGHQPLPDDVEEVEIARRWRLMNCAIVAEPAFEEAVIGLVDDLDEEDVAAPTIAASQDDQDDEDEDPEDDEDDEFGGQPSWLKKKATKGAKDPEDEDAKDGEKKNLPPWLKKKKTGKKMSEQDGPDDEGAIEDGETLDDEFSAPTRAKRDKAEGAGHAMPGGRYPVENEADLRKAIRAVGRAGGPDGTDAQRAAVRRHIIAQAKRLGLGKLVPANWGTDGSLKAALVERHAPVFAALAASAGPLRPPAEWFTDPGLPRPTVLTVTDDGRIYGHAAVWGTPHVGYPGRRVVPPRGADYTLFHHGVVRTRDEEDIAVGVIVLGTDHAEVDRETTVAEAMAHYAHSGFGVAVVRAGEDEHGVWINGAICPDVDELRLAALRRCSLSGDWRSVDGRPAFISALAVNVPGFPTPREQTDQHGVTTALVAAGVLVQTGEPSAAVAVPDARGWAREAFAELKSLIAADRAPAVEEEPPAGPDPHATIRELTDRMNAMAVARMREHVARVNGAA